MAFVRNPVVYVPDLTNGRPIVDGKVYLLTAGTVPPTQDSAINTADLLTVSYVNEAGNTVTQPQPLYTSKGGCLYGSFPEEARQYMIAPQEYVFAAYDKIGRLQYSAETTASDYVETDALAAVGSTVLVGGVEARQIRLIDGIKNLIAEPNIAMDVKGFYAGSSVGGGQFYYDQSANKSDHNGVTVIAPESLVAWDGTYSDLSTLFGWSGSGFGCFVKQVKVLNTLFSETDQDRPSVLTPEEAGAVMGQDASICANKCISIMQATKGAGGGELTIGGGELLLGSGEYIFNDVELFENITVRGLGRGTTTVKRTSNNHVFKAFGPAFDGTAPTLPWWSVNLKGMTITTEDGLQGFPLVEYRGITSSEISDVRFLGYDTNLLTLHQVWDSRFNFIEFLGGGRGNSDPSPTPALLFKSGYGYRQTKENFFSQCRWEAYEGHAISNDSEANTGGKKTELIGFSQCKLESKGCFHRHINLYLVTTLWFDQFYVTTNRTPDTEPVINIGGGQYFCGDLTIFFASDANLVFPKSGVRVIDANEVDLTVKVGALQPSTMWAVDWDGANPSDTNFDIYAPHSTVNGRYQSQKTFKNSTVRQLGLVNDSVQYVYAKDGRIEWSTGNPANPSSTNEDWYLRGAGTNFLTARSRGASPSASYRELIAGAHVQIGRGYLDPNQLRIGNFVFWIDEQNRFRRTGFTGESYPATDTSGFFFQTNQGGNAASRPTSPDIYQQYWDSTINKLIVWDGSNWKDTLGTIV